MADITITRDEVVALAVQRIASDHDVASMFHDAVAKAARQAIKAAISTTITEVVEAAVSAEMDKVAPGIKAAIEEEFRKHIKKVEGRITRHMVAQFGDGPGDV